MTSSASNSSKTKDVQKQFQGVLDELGGVEKELSSVRNQIDSLVQRQDKLLSKKQELKTKADQLQTLCQKLETSRGDFEKSDFAWSPKLHKLKSSVFGIDSLRAMQEQVMNTTMSGRDCLIVMPTGAGKSLCYQLPALLSDGITLVVSPLVSLMEDQSLAMEQLGVPVTILSASTPPAKLKETNAAMLDPKAPLRLLYVTPEKIAKSKRFMAQLQKCYNAGRLARIAIDEVHCCSQWGHDFRPDYKMLGMLKRQFPEAPVIGLTATATASVLEDVKTLLNLHACVVLRSSYNRANLYYQVRHKSSNQESFHEEIVELLNGRFKGQSGIIYCLSKKNTDQLSAYLQKSKIHAEPYHADLESGYRSLVHSRWKNGHTQVVVATIAFGMGIDKPDVRFVIHQSLSKSLENYYQESGRAGRDDKPAECILFFQSSDVFRQSSMVMMEQTGLEKLYAMVAYCINRHRCRRSIQAEHFEERQDTSQNECNAMCDNCRNKERVHNLQLNEHCATLLEILEASHKKSDRITPLKLIDVWLAKKPSLKLSGAKLPQTPSRTDCQFILCFILLEGYLKEDFHFTPYTTITYIVRGPKASRILGEPIVYKYRPVTSDDTTSSKTGAQSSAGKSTTAKTSGANGAKKSGQMSKQSGASSTKTPATKRKKGSSVGQKMSGKGDRQAKKRKGDGSPDDDDDVVFIL